MKLYLQCYQTQANLFFHDMIYSGTNKKFTEIWWHYASKSSADFNNKYVAFNYLTGEWSYGTLSRSVWFDSSGWLSNPGAYGSDGKFYYHEKGTSADGEALNWSIKSGTIEIPAAGENKFLH